METSVTQSYLVKSWEGPQKVDLYFQGGNFRAEIKSSGKVTSVAQNNLKNLPVKQLKLQEVGSMAYTFEGCYLSISKDGSSIEFKYKDIDIFLTAPDGKKVAIKINPLDTIKNFIDLCRKKTGYDKSEYIADDVTLFSENLSLPISAGQHIVLDYHIENGDTFSLSLVAPTGGFGMKPLTFNKLDKEGILTLNFDLNGPDYRSITQGLNLYGKCKSEGCKAFDKNIWIQKGIGTYHLSEELYESKCPSCHQIVPAVEINNLGFWDCNYKIIGKRIGTEAPINWENSAPKDNFTTFRPEDNGHQWGYLKIITSQR